MDKVNILKIAALSVLSILFTQPAIAAETYMTDQGHTEVRFGWNHAGVSIQSAEFNKVSGKLVLDADNVEKSKVTVTVDVDSLNSGFGPLDKDLKSKNFLDVANFPEITFESTSIKRTGEKTADITGNLTIHGITHPATLKATLTHRGDHPVAKFIDYYKGKWVAFSATTEIDHMAYKVGSFSTGPITIWISTEMKEAK